MKLITVPGGSPADLPARGLEDAVRRREHDVVRGRACDADGGSRDPPPEVGSRFGLVAAEVRLCHDHKPLGTKFRIVAREHGDAATPDAGDVTDRLFDLLRVQVPTGPDDEVLGPAREIQLPTRQVADIAGVEPVAVAQGLGAGGVAEVAARRRRSTEFHSPLGALGSLATGLVDDPHCVTRQGPPARHHETCGGLVRGGHRAAGPSQGLAVDRVDQRRPSKRRERKP